MGSHWKALVNHTATLNSTTMKPITPVSLHTYFCNQYKRRHHIDYKYQGKGLELAAIKRLLALYDSYQLMFVIEEYVQSSVFCSVNGLVSDIDDWMKEYAPDPLAAKAKVAIRLSKNQELIQAYYDYVDEVDAWTPNRTAIEESAQRLDELAIKCLN